MYTNTKEMSRIIAFMACKVCHQKVIHPEGKYTNSSNMMCRNIEENGKCMTRNT